MNSLEKDIPTVEIIRQQCMVFINRWIYSTLLDV